ASIGCWCPSWLIRRRSFLNRPTRPEKRNFHSIPLSCQSSALPAAQPVDAAADDGRAMREVELDRNGASPRQLTQLLAPPQDVAPAGNGLHFSGQKGEQLPSKELAQQANAEESHVGQ